mgnify:CR=1 FL=1|tara:strand:- start:1902 stop:2381 length:480 start_codon:yes stop_codon:yes gene_type:complete
MDLRELRKEDISEIWEINEQGLPGTGKVNSEEIGRLLGHSELAIGAFNDGTLLGFVICLLPRTEYGSPNYSWFNQRYDDFIYVDRIAIAENHRNLRIGSNLYQKVVDYAEQRSIPIAAEVSLEPPNPGSMRFHYRYGFSEVGILKHKSKSVTMMLRNSR